MGKSDNTDKLREPGKMKEGGYKIIGHTFRQVEQS
jgi:hypothetical protein